MVGHTGPGVKTLSLPVLPPVVGRTGPGVKTLSLPVLPNDLLHAPIRWHFDPTLARDR